MKNDADNIGTAISRIPSGCSILTVSHDGRSTGVLVSWVQQASFEPPSVTVCIKRERPVGELLDPSGRFVLNVIGEDPTAMFKQFGKGFSLDEDAFAGVATQASEFGPTIDSCIAHLGCAVLDKMAAGDHNVYLAKVVAASATPGASPYIHLRKSGLTY